MFKRWTAQLALHSHLRAAQQQQHRRLTHNQAYITSPIYYVNAGREDSAAHGSDRWQTHWALRFLI